MSHAYIHNIVAAGSLEMMVRGPGPPDHAVRVRPVVIDAAWVHSEREEGKASAKKVKSASISPGGSITARQQAGVTHEARAYAAADRRQLTKRNHRPADPGKLRRILSAADHNHKRFPSPPPASTTHGLRNTHSHSKRRPSSSLEGAQHTRDEG